jgi:hypothetical protein
LESNKILIKFVASPTVLPSNIIEIKSSILKRENCSSTFFNFFANESKSLLLPEVLYSPEVVINPPTSAVLSCYSLDIGIDNVVYDGLRGLKTIEWSVVGI